MTFSRTSAIATALISLFSISAMAGTQVICTEAVGYFGAFTASLQSDNIETGPYTLTYSREAGVDGDGLIIPETTVTATLKKANSDTYFLFSFPNGTFSFDVNSSRARIAVGNVSGQLNCSVIRN